MAGFPRLDRVAVQAGADYAELGIGWRPFAVALLAGAVITLMTWMRHSANSYGIKLIPAVTAGFLLAGGGLNHAVADSLLLRLLQVPHRVRGDRAAPAADVTWHTVTGRRKSHV